MLRTEQNPGIGYIQRLVLSNFHRVQAGQVSKAQAKESIQRAVSSKEELIEQLCREYNRQVVQACEYFDLI